MSTFYGRYYIMTYLGLDAKPFGENTLLLFVFEGVKVSCDVVWGVL